MLVHRTRTELGALATNGYSALPSSRTGVSPSDCLKSYAGHTLCGGFLILFRDTINT